MATPIRPISASDRNEWRAWLSENHASEKKVWLAYFKKHTGKATVSYIDSVKEALCFGWIQGAKRPETRDKRIKESIRFLEENKKLGMK